MTWLGKVAAILMLIPAVVRAGILGELNADQAKEVMRGGQVVLMEEVEGHPWPRIRVYQKVNACPEDVIAVFFDYQEAKSYIPKLLKSDVVKTVSPCVLEVDYGVDVPVLPDEFYTARNSLGREGTGYRVDWKLLRALQTKASEGCLRVEAEGEGSVICYTNLVTPGSKMAVVLRIPAIEQMKNTVRAIVSQVERQKTLHPAALRKQVEELRAALQAEKGQD
jgi:hypothetical protein